MEYNYSQQNTQNQTYQPQNFNQMPPIRKLNDNRGLAKLILLSIITLGIYSWFFYANIAKEVDIICSRIDGKKTMSYWLLLFIVGPFTLGIGYLVWFHKLCNRMGDELRRRNLSEQISAGTFWGWNIAGTLIIVGPLVFIYKFAKASNCLNSDYNLRG